MRVVHCKKAHWTHYIGRPGVFGNPYRVGPDGTRAECLAKFERYARNSPTLIEHIRALPADAVLGCWCKPQQCHGDVISAIWGELHPEQAAALAAKENQAILPMEVPSSVPRILSPPSSAEEWTLFALR